MPFWSPPPGQRRPRLWISSGRNLGEDGQVVCQALGGLKRVRLTLLGMGRHVNGGSPRSMRPC